MTAGSLANVCGSEKFSPMFSNGCRKAKRLFSCCDRNRDLDAFFDSTDPLWGGWWIGKVMKLEPPLEARKPATWSVNELER